MHQVHLGKLPGQNQKKWKSKPLKMMITLSIKLCFFLHNNLYKLSILSLLKLLLTLQAASHACVAVGAVVGEGGAVSKDETVLLLLQVAEQGAGRGLLAHMFAIRLAFKNCQNMFYKKVYIVFIIIRFAILN